MNTADQNKAIADVLDLGPYQKRNHLGNPSEFGHHVWHQNDLGGGAYQWCPIPNYVNDLNAMHRAERHIMDESSITYAQELAVLSCIWHAPADKRAEAFLKTLNLWTD